MELHYSESFCTAFCHSRFFYEKLPPESVHSHGSHGSHGLRAKEHPHGLRAKEHPHVPG